MKPHYLASLLLLAGCSSISDSDFAGKTFDVKVNMDTLKKYYGERVSNPFAMAVLSNMKATYKFNSDGTGTSSAGMGLAESGGRFTWRLEGDSLYFNSKNCLVRKVDDHLYLDEGKGGFELYEKKE